MRSTLALAAIAFAVVVTGPRAQQPQQQPPPQPQTAPVDPQLPKGIMPTLGRPTEATDKTPLFEFDTYFNGKTIRMKENWRLVSVLNYKVSMSVSIDGGRFTNYGNPWWQKQVPGVTSK